QDHPAAPGGRRQLGKGSPEGFDQFVVQGVAASGSVQDHSSNGTISFNQDLSRHGRSPLRHPARGGRSLTALRRSSWSRTSLALGRSGSNLGDLGSLPVRRSRTRRKSPPRNS